MAGDLHNTSLPYKLFLYKEEIQHPSPKRRHLVRRIRTKVELTTQLIDENMKYLNNYGAEDLRAINRQVDFKDELELRMELVKDNCIKKAENIPSTWL